MDKAEFWATKNPAPVYETVVFSHPSFSAPVRLVRDKFAVVTLGGAIYTPAPMRFTWPEQRGDVQPRMTIVFPRVVVGRTVKQRLREVQAAGSRAPITVTAAMWLGETDAPKITWPLYVSDASGIAFSNEAVQVTAMLDNPMRRQVAPIYDPAVFTWLELL